MDKFLDYLFSQIDAKVEFLFEQAGDEHEIHFEELREALKVLKEQVMPA